MTVQEEEGEGEDSRIVDAGRRREWTGGIVNPPVWRASTILFDDVAALRAANKAQDGVLAYGRYGTPTQWALAEALTALEPGAAGTRLFPSGVAAISIALLAILRPGDELLMVDSAYAPTRHFCDDILARNGIVTRYYDPLAGDGVEAAFGERTRAIFLESPGSLTFEVQDVPAICAAARKRGIVTLLDNSWATPFFFRAIEAGVDLAILACTKYVGGHSDVMLGAVSATEQWLGPLSETWRLFGQHVSPDDCFLAARGLRTLSVRLRRHEENAMKVAVWLAEQPQVATLLHPAFPSCPGHEVWKRDFRGASGLFAIRFAQPDAGGRFVDQLRRFGIGYSWGGFESLALPVEPRASRSLGAPAPPLVRLHVGLEDPDDLIADLAQALQAIS